MYLVDTTSFRRRDAARRSAVLVAFRRSAQHPSECLTLGEIMRGIALKQKSDPKAAAHSPNGCASCAHDHGDRILPVTDQIAVEWGGIARFGRVAILTGSSPRPRSSTI